MNSVCYILYSKSLDKFYIGATHEDVNIRIEKHNQGTYGKHRYTAAGKDWELYIKILAKDYPHAIRLERHIKSMKSRKYVINLKKYPELVEKIIDKTST